MRKNTYMVITETENGKWNAFVYKHNNSNNVFCLYTNDRYITCNICDSKKQATYIANRMNEDWKKEGRNIY